MRVFLLSLLIAGWAMCLPPGGDVQSGQAVYLKNCKVCHGVQGEGNPAIAKALKVTIPDLGSKEIQARSDDDIKNGIVAGKGKMKPVKVAGNELRDVVAYVRSLAKK